MSALLNKERRKETLKELILGLHQGKDPEEVKEEFSRVFGGISPTEISDLEQELIEEGMPVSEVQRLCDVHTAVFKGSIEEIHTPQDQTETPEHPVHTFKLENRAIEEYVAEKIEPLLATFSKDDTPEIRERLITGFTTLAEIDKHFSRKENLLFPYLEKAGITAPPKVMWGVDDEIRAEIKEVLRLLADYQGDKKRVVLAAEDLLSKISEMIYKEEKILLPMAIETLTKEEWEQIRVESEEVGYSLIEPSAVQRQVLLEKAERPEGIEDQLLRFETGSLSFQELDAILNHLPIDLTFIDRNDQVRYFSQSPDRIFLRPKAAIGRKVHNCHPPKSLHIVEKLLAELKSGKKTHEDFWLKLGDKYVHIRYLAVRDQNGEYLGTLEVSQDIKPFNEIEGEKRLLSD